MKQVIFKATITGVILITDEEAENLEKVNISNQILEMNEGVADVEDIRIYDDQVTDVDDTRVKNIAYDIAYDYPTPIMTEEAFDEITSKK